MVARNDITGDAITNMPKTGKKEGRRSEFKIEPLPEFKVYYCTRCHIKVSTSNDKCPCCGEDLPND